MKTFMLLKYQLLPLGLLLCAGCIHINSSIPPFRGDTALLAADPAAVEEVLQGKRQLAFVSWWGFQETDSTAFLQTAIDSGVPTLIVPNMGKPWITEPLFLRSNQRLLFEPGTVLQARKGAFLSRKDSLLSIIDCDNVTLEGRGSVIRMHKRDYTRSPYAKAEWRHCLNIRGSDTVRISGLRLENSGGDGIYIGRSPTNSDRVASTNIILRDCICLNNYRQGLSIISAENLLVENCQFLGTHGTKPMTGIDLEPNRADEPLRDITIRSCRFENNAGGGLQFWLDNMTPDAGTLCVRVENCRINNLFPFSLYIHGLDRPDAPQGTLYFKNNRFTGIRLIDKHPSVRIVFQ